MSQTQTLSVLRAARAKISSKRRWTTGALARNRAGHEVPVWYKSATCFCANGALSAVSIRPQAAYTALAKSANLLFRMKPAVVNDLLGHDAVLKMFDHAIGGLDARA